MKRIIHVFPALFCFALLAKPTGFLCHVLLKRQAIKNTFGVMWRILMLFFCAVVCLKVMVQ
jgi:hypothetical protein